MPSHLIRSKAALLLVISLAMSASRCIPKWPEEGVFVRPCQDAGLVDALHAHRRTDLQSPLRERDADATDGYDHLPHAFILPTSTCGETSVPLDAKAIPLIGPNYSLWHLCYASPTPLTSPLDAVRARPAEVAISVLRLEGETELARTFAHTAQSPWTMSVLVAIPRGQAPAFKFTNVYEDGQRVTMYRGQDLAFPLLHGELRLWLVQDDGTQQEIAPRLACRERDNPASERVCVVPDLACPKETDDCHLLHGLDCRHLRDK